MSARITILWLAVWNFLFHACPAPAIDRAYWVWQRTKPLAEAESVELHRQKVDTLYWHVATVDEKGVSNRFVPEAATLAPGFRVVPVVRMEMKRLPASETFLKLARFAADGALQLDFDVPDSQLGEYAARLTELRKEVPHLGITALAHWPQVKEFPALARSVEELCPMFYDLQNDPTGVSAETPPPPILDAEQAGKWIAVWKGCPTQWRAGLPAFSRMTIFDETGLSRGQIPDWEWDEVVFHSHLHTLAPTRRGVTLMQADATGLVARRPVKKGETVAVRTTDRAALTVCAEKAKVCGAAGEILFRLPAAGNGATCSLRGLADGAGGQPRWKLRCEGDALVLQNEGTADLEPRLAGERNDRDRGYTLEIDAPAAVFRAAEPGDFFLVAGHADPEAKPVRASVPLATRLTFWFSHLEAGGNLRSGIFQLSVAADPHTLRWRAAGGDWQPFDLP